MIFPEEWAFTAEKTLEVFLSGHSVLPLTSDKKGSFSYLHHENLVGLKIGLPYDPAVPLVHIYPEKP